MRCVKSWICFEPDPNKVNTGIFEETSTMKLADNKATLSFSNGAPSVDMPV